MQRFENYSCIIIIMTCVSVTTIDSFIVVTVCQHLSCVFQNIERDGIYPIHKINRMQHCVVPSASPETFSPKAAPLSADVG